MTGSSTVEEKLDFKRVLPIIFIIFVDLMGLTMIIPVLPYYALSYEAGPAVIGLLGASYPLMQLIGGPILSGLSDRFGRKPVLATAQVGTFLSLLLLGFSNALWMVFFARILDGITGANLPTVQAAISDTTTPKTRSQGLGLIGAAFGMGFIFGPMLSGIILLMTENNYSAPAFAASGFAFLSVLLTTFIFKETLPIEKRGTNQKDAPFSLEKFKIAFRQPEIGVLLSFVLMQQIVFGAFQLMFAPYILYKLGLNSVGATIAFVYIGLILVVVQGGLIRNFTGRFGERKLIIWGFSLLSVGLFAFTLIPQQTVPWYSRMDMIVELQQGGPAVIDSDQLSLLPEESEQSGYIGLFILMLAITPTSFGLGLLQPSVNSLLTQRTDPTKVGAILGISSALLSLGNIAGPLWGGVAFDYIAPAAPFLIGSIVIAILVPVAIKRI